MRNVTSAAQTGTKVVKPAGIELDRREVDPNVLSRPARRCGDHRDFLDGSHHRPVGEGVDPDPRLFRPAWIEEIFDSLI